MIAAEIGWYYAVGGMAIGLLILSVAGLVGLWREQRRREKR